MMAGEFNLAGFLLHLAAAAALLIWSVRLVRTGVERAFGRQLRGWMARSSRSRGTAAISGMAAALVLQSATAVLALVAGFSGAHAFTIAAGTAVLLGADLGSALVVRLISLHMAQAMPLLLLGGVVLFLKGGTSEIRQSGRILIGLGLIFVSLQMIRDAAAPLVGHDGVGTALGYLSTDAISAFVVGALLAWLVHSSVATVLLVVTLATGGLLSAQAAASIVLGANFGSCLIAVGLTYGASAQARAIVYANLMARGGGAILLLGLLQWGVVPMAWFGDDPANAAMNLHIAFNAAVLVACLPWIGVLARGAGALAQMFSAPDLQQLDRLPDPADYAAEPARALPRLRRELLGMGQAVTTLQREGVPLLFDWNSARASQIIASASTLRARHTDLKLFIAALEQTAKDPATANALNEIMQTGAALEGAASVLSGDLIVIARSLAGQGAVFSPLGQSEIRQFADQVAANSEIALLVLAREDLGAATDLIERKARLRALEQRLLRAHMARLAQRLAASMATSSQHQEVLRSLKQVNSYMAQLGSIVLDRHGHLAQTRLSEAPA